MSAAPNSARWGTVRWIGIHLAAAGMGCVCAGNMADDIPPSLNLPLMIAAVVLNGVGWGLLLAARRCTGQSLPRWWSDKPQPSESDQPGVQRPGEPAATHGRKP